MTPKPALETNPPWEKREIIKFGLSLLIGIFVVLRFGFFHNGLRETIAGVCKFLLLTPPEDLKAWECWEIGALFWSACTAVVFYFFTPQIPRALIYKPLVFVLTVVMSLFHLRAAYTLFEREHGAHIVWLLMIGIGFGFIDLLNASYQADPKEKKEAMQSLLFADVPMIIAFFIFMLYARKYGHDGNTAIFMSGAISFQFVASTFVFAFIQGGIPHRMEKRLVKAPA